MGRSWENVFMDTVNTDLNIKGMGVVNNMIFAGTKYSQFLCSKDNGLTWNDLTLTPGFPTHWFDPVAFVGISGSIFAASSQGYGIIRSNDSGTTWVRVNNGLSDSGVYCLAVKDTILFAGTYKGGVFKTIDKGNTWEQMSIGLPQIPNWGGATVRSISTTQTGIFAGTTRGLYYLNISTNTWFNSNIDTLIQGIFIESMLDLFNGAFLVGTVTGGVYKLSSSTTPWIKSNNGLNCEIVTDIAIGNNKVIASTYYGNVFLYDSKRLQWRDFFRTNVYPLKGVLIDSQCVYLGDAYSVCVSCNNGLSWKETLNIARDSNYYVQSITHHANCLFVSTDRKIYRMPLGDTVWENVTHNLQSGYNKIISNGARLFVAGTGVFISDDTGETWVNKINATPFKAIAVNGSLIVAADYNVGVYCSVDGGDTWISPQQHLPWVASLAATKNFIFAGINGGGVYVSRDSAKTWTAFNDSLPCMDVTALAIDDSILYAGTGGSSVFMININTLSAGVLKPRLSWRQVPTAVSLKMPSKNTLMLDYFLTSAGNIKIDIYDLLGHRVKQLFNGNQLSGKYNKSFNIKELSNNKYIVLIKYNGQVQSVPFNHTR
jgi:photosystem II stability/assembly factor-like uncharacterized protein